MTPSSSSSSSPTTPTLSELPTLPTTPLASDLQGDFNFITMGNDAIGDNMEDDEENNIDNMNNDMEEIENLENTDNIDEDNNDVNVSSANALNTAVEGQLESNTESETNVQGELHEGNIEQDAGGAREGDGQTILSESPILSETVVLQPVQLSQESLVQKPQESEHVQFVSQQPVSSFKCITMDELHSKSSNEIYELVNKRFERKCEELASKECEVEAQSIEFGM